MRKMYIFALLVLWSSIGLIGKEMGTIQGTVIDEKTGRPIQGVNVFVEKSMFGAVTGVKGKYAIPNVPTGIHNLIASRIGFRPDVREIEVRSGENVVVNFRLKETVLKIGQVVVTATKMEDFLANLPITVNIITAREIKMRGVKTLQDALEYIPGVKINRNSGSWGDKGKIEMEGLDAKQTLVLVDGQRVYGGHRSAVDLESYPIEAVKRIEVVKGPSSALYGSDAIGGVVNIITKSVPQKPTISASSSFGSRSTQVHEVNSGLNIGKFGTFLNYTYRKSNGIQEETDQYSENILEGNLRYKLTPQLNFNTRPYYSIHRMKEDGREQKRLGINSVMRWQIDAQSRLNLRGSYFNYKHWTEDERTNYRMNSYEGELNYTRVIMGKNTIIGGYHYQREERNDRGKDFNALQDIHSMFIQNKTDISPFVIIFGGRLDYHSKWGREITPKLSALYKVFPNLKIRASVGRGFRSPSLVKLYADNWRMGPFLVHSNPDLKPENSIGYQFGGDFTLSEKMFTQASFFLNDVKNLISSEYERVGHPPWDLYWKNIGEVTTQGIELNITTRIIDDLTGKLGYTFLETNDRETGKELPRKPRHKLNVETNLRIRKICLNLNLSGEYVGKRYDDKENTEILKGYTLYNLTITKGFKKHIFAYLRIDNLDNLKNIPDEYDIDGRTFLGGIRIKF